MLENRESSLSTAEDTVEVPASRPTLCETGQPRDLKLTSSCLEKNESLVPKSVHAISIR